MWVENEPSLYKFSHGKVAALRLGEGHCKISRNQKSNGSDVAAPKGAGIEIRMPLWTVVRLKSHPSRVEVNGR